MASESPRETLEPPAPPPSIQHIDREALERATEKSPSTVSVAQQALERRADWLQEDLEVVKRRAAAILGTGDASAKCKGDEVTHNLQQYANQLVAELQEETKWTEQLEAEISTIESMLSEERSNREKALGTLSCELESTMKSLVGRIDSGLLQGNQELNSRAAKIEAGLRSLIVRVEEGLVSGAKDLQELSLASGTSAACLDLTPSRRGNSGTYPAQKAGITTGILPSALAANLLASLPKVSSADSSGGTPITLQQMSIGLNRGNTNVESPEGVGSTFSHASREGRGRTSIASSEVDSTQGGSDNAEPLLKVWSELQEENMRLRQKRVQLEAKQIRSRLQSRSPGTSNAATPLGAASRNRSPNAERVAGGNNLGTGFRWRALGHGSAKVKEGTDTDCSSPQNAMNNVVQNFLNAMADKGTSSAKDIDAVSTVSSLPTSASVCQNQGQERSADPLAHSTASTVASGASAKHQIPRDLRPTRAQIVGNYQNRNSQPGVTPVAHVPERQSSVSVGPVARHPGERRPTGDSSASGQTPQVQFGYRAHSRSPADSRVQSQSRSADTGASKGPAVVVPKGLSAVVPRPAVVPGQQRLSQGPGAAISGLGSSGAPPPQRLVQPTGKGGAIPVSTVPVRPTLGQARVVGSGESFRL